MNIGIKVLALGASIVLIVLVTSVTFVILAINSMRPCNDIDECLKKGRAEREFFFNVTKEKSRDELKQNYERALLMRSYFQQAKDFGADVDGELRDAKDTVNGYASELQKPEELRNFEGKLKKINSDTTNVAKKIRDR